MLCVGRVAGDGYKIGSHFEPGRTLILAFIVGRDSELPRQSVLALLNDVGLYSLNRDLLDLGSGIEATRVNNTATVAAQETNLAQKQEENRQRIKQAVKTC